MNKTILDFARTQILEGLSQLPDSNKEFFKLMYGRNKGKRSVEDAKSTALEDVLLEIPEEKLDWALSQVEGTLSKMKAPSTDKQGD